MSSFMDGPQPKAIHKLAPNGAKPTSKWDELRTLDFRIIKQVVYCKMEKIPHILFSPKKLKDPPILPFSPKKFLKSLYLYVYLELFVYSKV